MSDYKLGTENDTDAPWNEGENPKKKCTTCAGEGKTWEEYPGESSGEPLFFLEPCEDCFGEGEIQMTDEEVSDARESHEEDTRDKY